MNFFFKYTYGITYLCLAFFKSDRALLNGISKIIFRTYRNLKKVLYLIDSILFARVLEIDTSKVKIPTLCLTVFVI